MNAPDRWRDLDHALLGLFLGLVGLGLTGLGLAAREYIATPTSRLTTKAEPQPDLMLMMNRFDGRHYAHISEQGYTYDPQRGSEVAFFPGYPLAVSVARWLTSSSTAWVQVVLANLCTILTTALFAVYIGRRAGEKVEVGVVVLACMCVPTSFFWHMGYSESLFTLGTVLSLLAVQAQAPLVLCAALIGGTTALRPVGVALVPLLWLAVYERQPRGWWWRALLWTPVASWGLLAYMAYLGATFGDPFIFATTQQHWRILDKITWSERLWGLATLQPIWAAYTPEMPQHWAKLDNFSHPLFSLSAVNALYFVGGVITISYGAYRRWLTPAEVLLSCGLLFIPYVTRSYDNGMLSMARFVSVVLPLYIVIAHWVKEWPMPVGWLLLLAGAVWKSWYSALFVSGYALF